MNRKSLGILGICSGVLGLGLFCIYQGSQSKSLENSTNHQVSSSPIYPSPQSITHHNQVESKPLSITTPKAHASVVTKLSKKSSQRSHSIAKESRFSAKEALKTKPIASQKRIPQKWVPSLSGEESQAEMAKKAPLKEKCQSEECMIKRGEGVQLVGVVMKTQNGKLAHQKGIDGDLSMGNGAITPILYVE